MRDYSDAKAMAKAMRERLAEQSLQISHSEALEIVARQFGVQNWNVLSARIQREKEGRPGDAVSFQRAVPIIRIFDVAKAHEFYLGFLGFSIDWEHRFGDDFPLYTQVSRAGLALHLSEHSGDASPGANSCIYMTGIRAYHRELTDKAYRYMKPGVEEVGDRLEMQVTDPFNNRLRFMEVRAA